MPASTKTKRGALRKREGARDTLSIMTAPQCSAKRHPQAGRLDSMSIYWPLKPRKFPILRQKPISERLAISALTPWFHWAPSC